VYQNRLDYNTETLGHLPGAEGAAFTTRLPLSWGNSSGPVRRPGDPTTRDWPALAGFRVITPNYFSVLRQPVLSGRGFTDADRVGSQEVAIVTDALAAKLWPGENAVGRMVATNYLSGKWLTVVGVVPEASNWSMTRGSQYEIFVPLAQQPRSVQGQLIAVVRTASAPAGMIPVVRAKLRELLPYSAAQLGTIDERIARSAADRRFAMLALLAFGAIALLLAAVGIYGVVWYVVTTRTREIGVRMALGATSRLIERQVLAGAATMAIGGIVVGIIGGVVGTRYLQASLYGVSRLDPSTYAIGAGLALIATLAGAYAPARRSSRIDPMTAIRAES
jgi:hypothetical protein